MKFLEDPKFWVAAATVTFVAMVFKPVKKMALAALDARISKVRSELDSARSLREESEKILAEAQEKLAQSEKQAEQILAHAKTEASNIIQFTKQKLEKDIEIRKNLALTKIRSLEESSIAEVKKNISALTILAAHTILEENVDDATIRRFDEDSAERIVKVYH